MLPALSLNGAVFDLLNDDIAGRARPVDDLMKFFAKYAIYLVVALLAASWFIRDGRAERPPHRRVQRDSRRCARSGHRMAGAAVVRASAAVCCASAE